MKAMLVLLLVCGAWMSAPIATAEPVDASCVTLDPTTTPPSYHVDPGCVGESQPPSVP